MQVINRYKKKIYELVEPSTGDDYLSKIFDIFILLLIIINVICTALETLEELETRFSLLFQYIERFSLIIFSIEYLLRIWSITFRPGFEKPILGRLKYVFTFLSIIDLLAIIPYYIPMLITVDLRILRALRLFRIFRLLKVERYLKGIHRIIGAVQRNSAELIFTFFILSIIILISASLVYFFESEVQPDKYRSIPHSLWWSVTTITSVGYGDVYPITPLGQFFGSLTALLGVALFALPAAILAAGLTQGDNYAVNVSHICPHCRKEI